ARLFYQPCADASASCRTAAETSCANEGAGVAPVAGITCRQVMVCAVTPSTSQVRACSGPTSTVTTRCCGPTATAEITRDAVPAATAAAPWRCCRRRTSHGRQAMAATKSTTTSKVCVMPLLSTAHPAQAFGRCHHIGEADTELVVDHHH